MPPNRISFTEENKLRAAPSQLKALKPAHESTDLLCTLMGEIAELDTSGSPFGQIQNATDRICGMAYRTARACMLVIAAGYVPEAFPLKRRITEAVLLTEYITADRYGNRANQWLDGRTPALKKLTAKKGEIGAIVNRYSSGAHVDQQGLPMLRPEGLPLSPSREPDRANHMLLEVAVEVRRLGYDYAWYVLNRDIGEGSDTRNLFEPLENELDDLI